MNMEQRFSGKTALITGAATGIGYEIALELGKEGANVVVNDIDEALLEVAVSGLREEGLSVAPVVGDAGSIAVLDQMVAAAHTEFGSLELCIANAGITSFGDFLSYTPEQFAQVVDLNLKGSFFLAQKAAQDMVHHQVKGRILLMSSVTGFQSHKGLSAYGISKAALRMMARTIGVELAPYGITINALAPGATLTERTLDLDPDYEEIWKKLTPLGKAATVKDIAASALFFLSDQAVHVTGQTLVIDGGWTSVSPSPDH